MSEVIKNIAADLDEKVDEFELGNPHLSTIDYQPVPLNAKNFSSFKPTDSDKKLAFVDGGNQSILNAPNFSIQFNRLYFNIFQGCNRVTNEKSIPQTVEFISVATAKFQDDEVHFNVSSFPLIDDNMKFLPDSYDLSFNSLDRCVMQGVSRADISHVAMIARRFAEWRLASKIVESELEYGDMIVMDGILRISYRNEKKYAGEAYTAASRKGVFYTALSKTSTLFTTTGLSLLAALRKFAADNKIEPPWYYYPVAISKNPQHDAAIFICRLRPESERVFRYEIQAKQAEELSKNEFREIFSRLYENSCDVGFPGYPYGLIDADANAKVTGSDVETHRTMLLSELAKIGSWPKLSRHIESNDAHDILDKLKEW
ncbi:DNA double-strand break repair nuclease NurA [Thermoproteota archaeon]